MKLTDTVDLLLRQRGHDIWSVSPDQLVYEAIETMADKGVGALLVISEGRLVGIISERDYARKVILKGQRPRSRAAEREGFFDGFSEPIPAMPLAQHEQLDHRPRARLLTVPFPQALPQTVEAVPSSALHPGFVRGCTAAGFSASQGKGILIMWVGQMRRPRWGQIRLPKAISSAIKENKIASRMEEVTSHGENRVMAGNLIAATPT